MFGSTTSLATALVSAAMSLGSLGGVSAPDATPAPADSDKPYMAAKEYAMADSFSCDYYNLPWCR
nr:hypothetical protein [Corynebacterium lactis]